MVNSSGRPYREHPQCFLDARKLCQFAKLQSHRFDVYRSDVWRLTVRIVVVIHTYRVADLVFKEVAETADIILYSHLRLINASEHVPFLRFRAQLGS